MMTFHMKSACAGLKHPNFLTLGNIAYSVAKCVKWEEIVVDGPGSYFVTLSITVTAGAKTFKESIIETCDKRNVDEA